VIRHACLGCPSGPAPTVLPLAVAMIEPAFQTLLVPTVGAAALMEPRQNVARQSPARQTRSRRTISPATARRLRRRDWTTMMASCHFRTSRMWWPDEGCPTRLDAKIYLSRLR
jgi:hypothetical protein